MIDRRGILAGGLAACAAMACGDCLAAAETDQLRAALENAVGPHGDVAGIVGAVVDEEGVRVVSAGSSGAPGVSLDGDTVFEMMSITKIMTALLLADMAARGEVAFDDPVTKYLPASVALHPNGRAVTLLDLAT